MNLVVQTRHSGAVLLRDASGASSPNFVELTPAADVHLRSYAPSDTNKSFSRVCKWEGAATLARWITAKRCVQIEFAETPKGIDELTARMAPIRAAMSIFRPSA